MAIAALALTCFLFLAGNAAAAAGFSSAGNLNSVREVHAATLLPDGKVLLAGGVDGENHWLATAELFDPKTGQFTPTNPMSEGRSVFTATLMRNGKVLVAGGNTTGFTATGSAETYDPATGNWSPAAPLLTERAYHSATLLQDGRVLVAGGAQDHTGVTLGSAELYDPETGQWSSAGSMKFPRAYHTATLLPDGKVLVAGGAERHGVNPYGSAELFDPKTGKWTLTGAMQTPRKLHTATALPDGGVLVSGGANSIDPDGTSASAEIFDPASGQWRSTPPMNQARYGHRAERLRDGQVLVTGGVYGNASAERYDPVRNRWEPIPPMREARAGHTETLLPDGRVLIAGGLDFQIGKFRSSAEIYSAAEPAAAFGINVTAVSGGMVQIDFDSAPGANVQVLGTADLNSESWVALGFATEVAPGQFRFLTDTGMPQRYFRAICSALEG